MSKKLKAALAKDEKDLTAEEKILIQKSIDQLDKAQKTKFAKTIDESEEDEEDEEEGEDGEEDEEEDEDEEDEEEEGIDEKSLKILLEKNADKALEKKADKYAEKLVNKFFAGVSESRKKFLETGKSKKTNADDQTRKFLKALFDKDYAAAKALTTSTSGDSPDDAAAGLTIPTELLTEVYRFLPTYGVARRNMRYLPFTGPGNERNIPALSSAVSVFWTGEGVKKTSTQPKFSLITQTLKKLAAICPMTEEILEDSAIPLNSLVGELFAEAIGVEEDAQFLSGTGSPWTGVLNNASVNQISQITAGTANATAKDLLNMRKGIPTSALANAKYYLNPESLDLFRGETDDNGRFILQQPTDNAPGTLWGRPYELTDALPTPDAVADGEPWIIFGDLNKTCILGDKKRIRVKLLEEATITDTDGETEINLAEQDMVAIRVVERVGFVCALPTGISVLVNEAESGS